LKSATDVFPIELQEIVVQEITNEEFATSWKSIMVNRP
jgi:hypothetical protein